LEEAGVDELADALLAETFDVHRATAREVHDALHALRGTVEVHAVVVRLALEANELRVADRALLRELPRTGTLRPLRQHGADDLRDHVTRLAHDDRVADAHVLARDRPARRLARGTELLPLAQIVDLHDDAVALVREVVTLREHRLAARVHLVERREPADAVVDGQAEPRDPLQRLVVGPQPWPTFLRAELVAHDREIAPGRDRGVLLAQRAGGRVARVR